MSQKMGSLTTDASEPSRKILCKSARSATPSVGLANNCDFHNSRALFVETGYLLVNRPRSAKRVMVTFNQQTCAGTAQPQQGRSVRRPPAVKRLFKSIQIGERQALKSEGRLPGHPSNCAAAFALIPDSAASFLKSQHGQNSPRITERSRLLEWGDTY